MCGPSRSSIYACELLADGHRPLSTMRIGSKPNAFRGQPPSLSFGQAILVSQSDSTRYVSAFQAATGSRSVALLRAHSQSGLPPPLIPTTPPVPSSPHCPCGNGRRRAVEGAPSAIRAVAPRPVLYVRLRHTNTLPSLLGVDASLRSGSSLLLCLCSTSPLRSMYLPPFPPHFFFPFWLEIPVCPSPYSHGYTDPLADRRRDCDWNPSFLGWSVFNPPPDLPTPWTAIWFFRSPLFPGSMLIY